MSALELAREISDLAFTKKARDVVIMDLRNLSDVTDYYVVCSADSDTQVKAISDAIADGLAKHGIKVLRREGYSNLQWVLLDYFDVVAHIFQQRTREFYDLERLWGDALMEHREDTPIS